MKNFKGDYDALQSAIDSVNVILDSMETTITSGTDEDAEKALAMVPALEAAQAKVDRLGAMYNKMVEADAGQDSNASRFVPVNQQAKTQAEGAKTMTRAEWDNLAPQAKHEFFKNGGRLEDGAAE